MTPDLPSFGGPIVTAGGLAFIGGAVIDNTPRAFDVETGELLRNWQLPATRQTTPMKHLQEGRQYVVIYAGGNSRAKGGCVMWGQGELG
ncbi:MAG: hypothetical protein F4184_00475 [Gemmatimonadetes bacterium]|nr:hypothetical protein [Gemmatimonadota bacterium]